MHVEGESISQWVKRPPEQSSANCRQEDGKQHPNSHRYNCWDICLIGVCSSKSPLWQMFFISPKQQNTETIIVDIRDSINVYENRNIKQGWNGGVYFSRLYRRRGNSAREMGYFSFSQ